MVNMLLISDIAAELIVLVVIMLIGILYALVQGLVKTDVDKYLKEKSYPPLTFAKKKVRFVALIVSAVAAVVVALIMALVFKRNILQTVNAIILIGTYICVYMLIDGAARLIYHIRLKKLEQDNQ